MWGDLLRRFRADLEDAKGLDAWNAAQRVVERVENVVP